MSEVPRIDWTSVTEETARLILDQGEKMIAAQNTNALAADARALTASTIFVGFSTALFAAAAGLWESPKSSDVSVAGFVAGAIMLIGAISCGYSARPTDIYTPGNEPREWWPWVQTPIKELIGKETENYQEKISENNSLLSENAKWLNRGVLIASSSPVLGVISWILMGRFF